MPYTYPKVTDLEKTYMVSSRTLRAKGQHKNGMFIDPSNNADAFFVIE